MYTFDVNELLEKIAFLLKEKKKTQKDLCEYLGVGKQAFTNWKSGFSKSYTKYLPQIASFFDVSVDYLIGKTKQKKSPITEGNERTEQIMSIIKDLDVESQSAVLAIVEQMRKRQKESH